MKPFAPVLLLLAALVASAFAPQAIAQGTANCTEFEATGVGPFGPFTIAFDLPAQVACITWWCAPDGYADYYERTYVNWGGYIDASGLFTFYTNGGELLWNAKYSGYAAYSGLVEAYGLDDYLVPMAASAGMDLLC